MVNKPYEPYNLEGLGTDALRAISKAVLNSVKAYGPDPATLHQAAAHEAGHVVVAKAFGDTINGVRLIRRGNAWGGCNLRNRHEPNEILFVSDKPDLALKSAMILVAGYLGEMVARHDHPSSSLDERMKAQMVCATLDATTSRPKGMTNTLIGWACIEILSQNKVAFDTVRGHLGHTRRLTQDEADRMLASVRTFDLTKLDEVGK